MIRRWTLLVAWMGLIFWFSAQPDLRAVPLAQRFGFLPALLGEAATRVLELVLRKSAHMAEYAILAVLTGRALAATWPHAAPRRLATAAFATAVLYAMTDEFHQTFVPSRMGSPVDVAIDAVGAGLGLWIYRALKARRGHFGTS